mgnify:CR=1 FL=1
MSAQPYSRADRKRLRRSHDKPRMMRGRAWRPIVSSVPLTAMSLSIAALGTKTLVLGPGLQPLPPDAPPLEVTFSPATSVVLLGLPAHVGDRKDITIADETATIYGVQEENGGPVTWSTTPPLPRR